MPAPRLKPIKWEGGKPTKDGLHRGDVNGVPFDVEIFTDRLHSQRTTWAVEFKIFGQQYGTSGPSGGIQRALSCLREDLEVLCRKNGVV